MRRTLTVAAAFTLAASASAQPIVRIMVDMDPRQPGIQHTVVVAPQQTLVRDVAVYIFAVEGAPTFMHLGYIGAIDRGLILGHTPVNAHRGSVAAIEARAGTPLYPGTQIALLSECCVQPWFEGPEVHYLELGGSTPAVIPPWPVPPVFTVDISLKDPRVGDVYGFHLLDGVAANWRGGRGMFTTQTGYYIDTGGDATPDSTPTTGGLDPDHPVPVPPASFVLDIVDGPPSLGGGATIRVVCTADFDHDGTVTSQDVFHFLAAFFSGQNDADFNHDGAVTSQDFFDFLGAFFAGCA